MQQQLSHHPRPAWSGTFTLPRVEPEVPRVITNDGARAMVLARFAAAATEVGLPLPEGTYAGIEEVVRSQWAQYIEKTFAAQSFALLHGGVSIEVTDERLTMWAVAPNNLEIFQAKPVVEALESACQGLGWFVYRTVTTGHSHGLGLYDMEVAASSGLMYLHDIEKFTDDAYAAYIWEFEEGNRPEDFTPDAAKEMRENYNLWPSEFLAQLDGHGHILHAPGCKWPKMLTSKSAVAWLRSNPDHELAGVVAAAVAVQKEWDRDKTHAFCLARADQDDDTDFIGAPAFIAWDSPELLLELVRHHEEYSYNGGSVIEAFGCAHLSYEKQPSDQDLRAFASNAMTYFKRWHLLAQCLSHFPTYEEDDET
jgi:PRTRC genetic system protein F